MKYSLYDIPIKTTDELPWYEKLLWAVTPSQKIITSDGTLIIKKRSGQIFIVEITPVEEKP